MLEKPSIWSKDRFSNMRTKTCSIGKMPPYSLLNGIWPVYRKRLRNTRTNQEELARGFPGNNFHFVQAVELTPATRPNRFEESPWLRSVTPQTCRDFARSSGTQSSSAHEVAAPTSMFRD